MAEARAAVNTLRVGTLSLEQVSSAAKLRGIQVHGIDGGFLIVIPSSKFLWRQLETRMRYVWQHFQTLCWPAPVWGVLGTIMMFMMIVQYSENDSWYKTNNVANFLWSMDENLIGFLSLSDFFPRNLRILYISCYTALGCVLFLSLLNRLFIRLLLQYRGWMYERKPSLVTTVWAGIMRTFFLGQGKNALMYSFQNAMPRLAVPPLQETMDKYLRSVEPLMTAGELAETRRQAAAFVRGDGPGLQRLLVAKSWLSGNYVSDWWEKYIYLRSRAPLLINSNYYGLGYAYHIPSHVQTSRAAVLVHYLAVFRDLLDSERLPPTTIRGAVPVCMRQFERIFATTRVPGRDTDRVVHEPGAGSSHVAVLYRGTWWRLDTLSDAGALLEPCQLQDQLDSLVAAVDGAEALGLRVPGPGDPEAKLAALTAWNRTRWAEVREDCLGAGLSGVSLREVEAAMFVLHLDERAPADWSETARLALHGGGACRWCDKSFNLVVFANGQASVHAEHSWADAPVVAYTWEWVLSHEFTAAAYGPDGRCRRPALVAAAAAAAADPAQAPRGPVRLEWVLDARVRGAIEEAAAAAAALCDDLDLVVDCFATKTGGYGKGLMKRAGCGPDSWVQLALQLACFRDQGRLHLTYESAATRLFNEGRTETIRSVSAESRAFVEAMHDPALPPHDKIRALRRAAERHQQASRDASCGRGVDRHLFALFVAATGLGKDVGFLREALAMPWRLSTSQIPQRQTEVAGPCGEDMVSPSGGFGPVADDGYGVSYMLASDNQTFFHVSSKRSCPTTDSARFVRQIWSALHDMAALFPA